jgi:hypothetical protein
MRQEKEKTMKTMKQAHEESCRAEGLSTEDIQKDWEQVQSEYEAFLDEVGIDEPATIPACNLCGEPIEGTPVEQVDADGKVLAVLCEECALETGLLDTEPEEHDPFLTDAEADADVLASAGWGTDEDYGCYDDGGWGEDF